MKYAMCPKCGRRLCKGENGTKVEMECPKCGEFASVIIEEDDIHISKKPIFMELRVSDDQEKEVVYEKIEEEKTDRDKQVSKWLTSRNVLIFVARHYEKNRPSDWRIYAPIVNARHFKDFMLKGGSPIGFVEESRDGNIIVYGKKFAIKW